ncbi:MAG: TrbI/VirB10 family protein [Pseudomonadota bacterium]
MNSHDNDQSEDIVTLRGASNPDAKTFSRKAIFFSIAIFSLAVCLAINSIFDKSSMSDKKEVKNPSANLHTSEIVNDYPDNYSQVKKTPTANGKPANQNIFNNKLNESNNALIQTPHEKSQIERFHEEEELERVKADHDAIHSKITFNNSDAMQFRNQTQTGLPGDQAAEIARAMQNQGGNLQGIGKPINSDRDNSNRQDDKADFANKKHTTDPYLKQGMVAPISPYYISQGTIIPGVLLTGINSDLPGQISGQVSQDVFDTITGNYLIIPQGSKLTGEYNSVITYGQERVQVIWTRIIRPDGTSISLDNMPGADLAGNSGLSDQVNNHWGKLLSGVVLSSIIGAGSQVAQGSTANQLNPGFGQLATQGASQNVTQVGQQITQKNLEIQPTLEIRAGMRFNVYVTKDVELPVYQAQTN